MTGNQGPGTLADELIQDVLQLQGTMQPHQVISLEDLPGETSFAMADHYDHVHVGYRRRPATTRWNAQFSALLKPDQWQRPDRPPRGDRKPRGADQALEVLPA